MIRLTKLDDSLAVVNADQILVVERIPDTQLLLHGGIRLTVKEDVETVIDRVVEFRRRISRGPIVKVYENETA